MATVYLCIGTQKTGTTSLQYFMRANEGVLKEQGYSYPYMDIGTSTAGIVSPMILYCILNSPLW